MVVSSGAVVVSVRGGVVCSSVGVFPGAVVVSSSGVTVVVFFGTVVGSVGDGVVCSSVGVFTGAVVVSSGVSVVVSFGTVVVFGGVTDVDLIPEFNRRLI